MKDLEHPPTFPLKEWLTLDRAARYLSGVLREEVTEADILRFARQKLLTLSVHFPNMTKVKSGQIIHYHRSALDAFLAKRNDVPAELEWILLSPEGARSLPELPAEVEGNPVLVIRILKIDADHYVRFTGHVRTVGGVWDLPMIGGEQLDIEEEFQRRIGGQPLIYDPLEGVIVREKSSGDFYQLQEQYNVKEYSSFWDAQHREVKQYISDGDLHQEDAERLISLHKAERKQILKAIKAMPDLESYYPARRLPKDSNVVARTDALLEFVKLVKNSDLDPNSSTVRLGENSSPRSTCKAVSRTLIMRHFNVKPDPDKNAEWWKEMMSEAARNRLAECRVGAARKGSDDSMWRPDLVAGWLVDRNKNGWLGLDEKAAGAALRKFPGCDEAADDYFSSEG